MSELVTKAFAAIVKATTTDPTGHLPNCGYTDESQVCGCAAWGARLHDALTASLNDAYQRGQRDLAAKVEALAEEAAERAYFKIAVENMLTIQTRDGERAIVPPHWRGAAEAVASVPVADLRALLADTLPQEGAEEPGNGPRSAREGGNGQGDAGEGERDADRRTEAQGGCEHQWMTRGHLGDEWRECFLCDKQEDV